MAEKSLAERLLVKPGQRLAVIDAPEGTDPLYGSLPAGATLGRDLAAGAAVVHLWVRDRAALERSWPAVAATARASSADTTIWISYPKKSGRIPTDITRDAGWAPVLDAGYDPVSQFAVDGDWSALRFRHDPALRERRIARGARVGGR